MKTLTPRHGHAVLAWAILSSSLAVSPLARGAENTTAAKLTATMPKGVIAAVYDRAAPAVVGLECRQRVDEREFEYFGTGVIIDRRGLVLTSITVVPADATRIRVYMRGGATFPAEVVRTESEKEFSLLRITRGESFPYLDLGDSEAVRVGQFAMTLGNAFHSIRDDDQVTLAAGLVSGSYTLTMTRAQARYLGPVFETTAAVNDGMDGGPLLNERGEIIGLLSLNFSTNRWLGTAIPINYLKPLIRGDGAFFSDRDGKLAAYLGIDLLESTRGDARELFVVDVHGPAEKAGLRPGEVIRAVGDTKVTTVDELRALLESTRPGAKLHLRLATPPRNGEAASERSLVVPLWGRF